MQNHFDDFVFKNVLMEYFQRKVKIKLALTKKNK
jgi:hypothetical protein